MGRFYQTDKPTFIDDFIYQPPWELIQQNNILEAQNYADQLKNINILGSPIRFWDKPDGEKALEIQKEIDSKVDEFTQNLKNDPNSEKTQQAIRDYSRQMRERYQAGDIYKIQKQKDTYDKYMAYAEKLPPGEKEIFLRQAENYLKPNVDGTTKNALNTPFDYMEHQALVTGEDYFKTNRFKTLEADIKASSGVKIGGQFIAKTSSNVEELTKAKISEDMKAWLQEQGFDKNNAAKYWSEVGGIQNLYDKEGNLGFDKGTYLGDMVDTASTTHAYKKNKYDEDVDINQYGIIEKNQAFEREMEERKTRNQMKITNAARTLENSLQKDVEPDIPQKVAKMISGHLDMENYMNMSLGENAKKAGYVDKKGIPDVRGYISKIMSNIKYYKEVAPKEVQKVQDIFEKSKSFSYASKAELIDKFPGYTAKIEKAMGKNILTSKSSFLIPMNNSTHGRSKATITELNSGNYFINGERVKKGSLQISTDQIMTVPASTLEGSVAVYPVKFINSKGEKINDYIYKNLGEVFTGR